MNYFISAVLIIAPFFIQSAYADKCDKYRVPESANAMNEAGRFFVDLRNETIPEECKAKPNMTLKMRSRVSTSSPTLETPYLKNMLDTYQSAQKLFTDFCQIVALDPNAEYLQQSPVSGYAQMCELGTDAMMGKLLESKLLDSWVMIENIARVYSGVKMEGIDYPLFLEDTKLVLQVYHETLYGSEGDGKKALSILATYKDKMTLDQKLDLVRLFGSRFKCDYDTERRDSSVFNSSATAIDISDLLKTASYNSSQMTGCLKSEVKAGVCRDIASAEGQMMQVLGFRDVYVVSMANGPAFHTVVVGRDRSSNAVYGINYGDLYVIQGREGGAALNQIVKDVGLGYRIFEPAGKMVDFVPGENYKILLEVAGGDIETLDPMLSPTSSIAAVDLPLNKKIRIRGYVASDGIGRRYYGVAGDYSYGSKDNGGSVGMAAGTIRTPYVSIDEIKNADYDHIFARIEHHLNSRNLNITDEISARVETTAAAAVLAGKQRDGFDYGNKVIDGDGSVKVGLRVRQGNEKSRIASSYCAGAQATLGISDVRNNYFWQLPTIVPVHFLFCADVRVRLSKSPEGRTYLLAATTALLDTFGWRARGQTGLVRGDFSLVWSTQGRLKNDMAPYEEGVQRKTGGSLTYRPTKDIQLDFFGEKVLESDPAMGRGFNFMGSFTLRR